MASHRIALLLVSTVAAAAPPAPPAPTDPCALGAFNELVRVQARITAMATAHAATLAEKLELAMDMPTGYVMQPPGNARFRDLFAATDANELAAILTDMDHDLDAILHDGGAWRYRCEAYPTSNVSAKPPDAKALGTRSAIAARTVAAHARADECTRLQNKVLGMAEAKRFAFTGTLDRCYADLEAARSRCERDFAEIEHVDSFAPYRASLAVSNLIELRHDHTISSADVDAVRARVLPMLDALRPPLAALAAPSRDAFARKDPVAVLYELSGALKRLYNPCEGLWFGESRCIVQPDSCRKKPN